MLRVLEVPLARAILASGRGRWPNRGALEKESPGMTRHRSFVAVFCAVALAASACGSSGTAAPVASPTPTASQSSSAEPTASASTGFYLRWWTTAALGPEDVFAVAPLVISDGSLVAVMYAEEALYTQPVSQTISPAGLAKIKAEALADGLLGSISSVECPHAAGAEPLAGASTGHLMIVVDGVSHELTAECAYDQPSPAPGTPEPGTWAAYQRFGNLLADPATWLGADLGPEQAFEPDGLLVLTLLVPDDIEVPDEDLVTWPLESFEAFGSPLGDSDNNCAVVRGADMASLLAVVEPLSQGAVFVDEAGDWRMLMVRAFMPGEPDPCA
jgi:hypothetical protein